MKVVLVLVSALVVVVTARYLSVVSELELQAHRELKLLFDLLMNEEQMLNHVNHKGKQMHRVTLESFSYSNCADPKTEIVVPTNLTVSPDPIHIPGVFYPAGAVQIKSPFGSPVKVQLNVWKSVFGVWIEVPCIDQFGSCTYDDLCTIINPPTCPPQFVKIGLNCRCPLTAGNWTVPPFAINITASLPVKVSGGVKARAVATYNGNLVTCAQVIFDLA